MAVTLRSLEVSDLCLGKPALRWLPVTAAVSDALKALKKCGDNYLSVWSCDHSSPEDAAGNFEDCLCIGKVCMVDIICYLCSEENLLCPFSALRSPITVLLPKIPGQVLQVQPHSSLLQALDLISGGAQNLIVPIPNKFNRRSGSKKLQKKIQSFPFSHHNTKEFCWLTEEDVVRFLLNHIGVFSPIPATSIEDLGLIRTEILMIDYQKPTISAVKLIKNALLQQTSVAVVTGDPIPKLIGEISPLTLLCCDETVSPAIAVLTAGDLMTYIDCGGPPEFLVDTVKARLKEKNIEGLIDLLEEFSCSSDEEFPGGSPTGHLPVTSPVQACLKSCKSGSFSSRSRRAEAIVCHPRSSLVAVMIQALAHRVNYVWVIENDFSLVGIVTFTDMLAIFRDYLLSTA